MLSRVRLTATPWTIGRQASLSMGISQARILDWVAMPSSRGSSQSRVQTQVSCIAGGFFTVWATREAHMIGPRSYLRQGWVGNLVFHTVSPSWCYNIKNLWIVLHPSMQWGRGKREPHLQETAKSTPAPSCALKMNQTRWCKLVEPGSPALKADSLLSEPLGKSIHIPKGPSVGGMLVLTCINCRSRNDLTDEERTVFTHRVEE